MVGDFYFQGLNILEFHAVSFSTKWHLEFTRFLRRFRGRKYHGLYMWDQEEGCQFMGRREVLIFGIE